jgi:hypothetical protein
VGEIHLNLKLRKKDICIPNERALQGKDPLAEVFANAPIKIAQK